jgi:hypothetical protein
MVQEVYQYLAWQQTKDVALVLFPLLQWCSLWPNQNQTGQQHAKNLGNQKQEGRVCNRLTKSGPF